MTPLERAAVAVREEVNAYRSGDMWMMEGGRVGDDYFRDIARAVLIAIREPSEGMVHVGLRAPNYVRGCGAMFTAMIDAALAEEG